MELSPKQESDYERHAEMLRHGLDISVADGFMTQEQADEWYAYWILENSEHLELPDVSVFIRQRIWLFAEKAEWLWQMTTF